MAVLRAVDPEESLLDEDTIDSEESEVEDIDDVDVIDTLLVIPARAFFFFILRALAAAAGSIDTIWK